jgi:nucleotide-binding universal stress UspA family protein
MYSRILIPVDLSDRNAPALEAAAELAGQTGCSVLLLHVIEEVDDVEDESLAEFYRGLRGRAEASLAARREELETRGLPVDTRIRMGKRGAEIVRCVQEERCDLVVLRSHVLDPDEPFRGIGTISHQVALAAPCAVLLVR